jgi:hypothetical protein
MTVLYVVLALIGAFVAGKVYGARVEAESVAAGLRLESYAFNETGKMYAAVKRHIRDRENYFFARVKKYL